jgi:hypothetical protein
MHYSQAQKSFYQPKNPKKYKGNVKNIVARSSWERSFMRYLDLHPSVLLWASEEIVIPYYDPTNGKLRRYFPDFYVELQQKDGSIKILIIEVKPLEQTKEPQKRKRITKRYIQEVMTYGTNMSKFEAAKEYCEEKGWEFKVITEKELGIA